MGPLARLAVVGPALILLLLLHCAKPAYACITGCHGMQADKAYKEGTTYVYELEGSAVTSVSEGQGEGTLKLKADVELTVKPDCLRQVRLKNVQVNGAPVTQPELEKYALQFNYHHGHIDSDLCAEPGDSQASLNLKRAVISLFQSAVMQDEGTATRHEIDVLGGCPTQFTFYKDGDVQTVHKERNLNRCAHRENIKHGLFSGIVSPKATSVSTPLLQAHQRVEQRFKAGVLDKAVSTETYKLRPFSNGDAGAKTVVETVLSFKSTKGDVPAAPVSLAKSLIFDAPHPVIKSSPDAITAALQAIHKDGADAVVKAEEAGKFSELIRVLRVSNKKDIMTVYNGLKDKPREKKMLLDALFRTGTGEASEVLVDLIRKKELVGTQALVYFASLAFTQHVNPATVSAVTELVDQPNLPRIGYLGVGHIIGKYCEQHPCENNKDVKAALDKMMTKVKDGKTTSRTNENTVLAMLKALGNAKYLDDGTLTKLANIAADKGVRNRVRATVLETLPTKCSSAWEPKIMDVFADQDEDSEIRIKAYLAVVACPCNKVAAKIREVMDKEPTYQVGSFVQSHLRNLRASVDPFKQSAKVFLAGIRPKNQYPEDVRKFSFNSELSYDLEGVGLGSTAESNIIYSQNSFVPRSASLNLTTDLFGHSFNFLELNARAENVDRLLEHFFGPKGHYTQQSRQGMLINAVRGLSDSAFYINERLQKTVRGKRDVKQTDLDNFQKSVQLRSNEVDQDLDIDLSMKLFGVELAFLTYDTAHAYSPRQVADMFFEALGGSIKKIKNLQYDTENHLHFLDADLIYPTALGVSMNLGISGSSVMRVKSNSKIDIPNILADPSNAAVRIALEPSASIEFVGDMVVVDGFGSEAGIRVLTTLHTATGYDLNIKVLDGKGIDINLGLPKKKQEIISVSSDVLYKTGKPDKYVPLKFGKGKERSDCFDQLSIPLGFTLCGHISYPYENLASVQKRPMYPLNGPLKFKIAIENDDVTSIHFRTFFNTKDPQSRKFEVLFETPNSKINRRVGVNVEGTLKPDPKFVVSIDSPLRKAAIEFSAVNNDKEHTAKLTVMNDKKDYYGRIGVESLGANKYKPVLEYKLPEQIDNMLGKAKGSGQRSQLQGVVEVSDNDGGKKFKFNDVRMEINGRKLLGLDGNAAWSPKSIDVDLNLGSKDDKLNFKVDGKKNGPQQYHFNAYITPVKNPASALGFEYKYNNQKPILETSLAFVQGPNFKDEKNRISLTHKIVYETDPKKLELSIYNKFSAPHFGYLFVNEGKVTKKSFDLELDIKANKFNAGVDLSAKLDKKTAGDIDVELEAEVLDNKLKIEHKRSVLSPTKTKYENSIKMIPGGIYSADALLTWDKTDDKMVVGVDGEVNFNGKKFKLDAGAEGSKDKCHSHAQLLADGIKYLDYDLELTHTPSQKGVLALTVKGYAIANGQYNYQNGKGTGNINLEFLKINRKVKGTGDFAMSGTKHSGSIEILYDADKNPDKKIKLSTDNEVSKESINSKNSVEFMKYKTDVNGRVKRQAKPGPPSSQLAEFELEITLPNGRYLSGKFDYNEGGVDPQHKKATSKLELLDSIMKGGKSHKLLFSGVSELTGEDSISTSESIEYVNPESKNVVFERIIKINAEPKVGKVSMDFELNARGSLIEHPASMKGSLNQTPTTGLDLKGSVNAGKDFVAKGSSSFVRGNSLEKPNTLKYDMDAKFPPNDYLKNIKIEGQDTFVDQADDKGVADYNGLMKLIYNDDKKITTDIKYKQKGSDNLDDMAKFDYTFDANIQILDKPALIISDVYSHDLSGDIKKMKENSKLKYGDKELSSNTELNWNPDLSHVNFKALVLTPFESTKKIDLQVDHKREANKSRKTVLTLMVNDKKYTKTIEVDMEDAPGIHVIFTCPAGQTEILAKYKKISDKEYTGEYKLATPQHFITASGKIQMDGPDDFTITIDTDSDKFKHRKIHAEIANKPNAAEGRKIFITITSEGKNIVTGSTNYKRHEEDRKVTIEGSGSLQVGDNTKSSSFKYIRKQLTEEADKEVGVAIMLNSNFGNSAIVGEVKFSDKEVHIFNSFCEQSKDCAHVKLQSTLDTDHSTHFNHQLQIEVNLKKFNVPVEFGLMTSTKADTAFDHQANLYLHTSKDRTQYTYHVYANKLESAAVITLPSRELAIVVSHEIPLTKNHGSYKIDVSLYLDRKNKPSDRTSLLVNGDVAVNDESFAFNGDAKFTYPQQTKDMSVKGKLNAGRGENLLDASFDLDVFDQPSQKISGSARVKRSTIPKGYNLTADFDLTSKGQQLKVESRNHLAASPTVFGFGSSFSYTDKNQKPKNVGIMYSATPQEIILHADGPNKRLVDYHKTMTLEPGNHKYSSELALLGNKPVVSTLEFKDYKSFNYVYQMKGDDKNKITAQGKFMPGQIVEVTADEFKNGQKLPLGRLALHLDEAKFLQPEVAYENENIMDAVKRLQARVVERSKGFKQVGDELVDEVGVEMQDLFNHLKSAQPSLDPLIKYYTGELTKLKDELHADQTIKEIQDILDKSFGGIVSALLESLKTILEQLEALRVELGQVFVKLGEAIKASSPGIKKSLNKIADAAIAVLDAVTRLLTQYLDFILRLLKEHQKDLEDFGKVISQFFRDVVKVIHKICNELRHDSKIFMEELTSKVHSLPFYTLARDTYNQALDYRIPDSIINPIEEFCKDLKTLMPTQELKDFFSTLIDYIIKHVKHEKVDDPTEVKKIYSQALNAARSMIALLHSQATTENVYGLLHLNYGVELLKTTPKLADVRLSLVKLVLGRELPNIADLYHTYRPQFYLSDSVPPATKFAYLVSGGFIHTFDGKSYILPGTCDYILAQDMQDGNFSIVGSYNAGNLVGVTMTERGHSITIKSDGKLSVDGKPTEYPASTDNLDAFIVPPMYIIKSKYGAKVSCWPDGQMRCYVRVSGYYHGKLRGLLGDADNEPYDDQILPSGKVSPSLNDFGNAYKLDGSCAPATALEKDVPRAATCTKYFTDKSSLSPCFSYVDPKVYRTMCDRYVAAKQPDAACSIARAYSMACVVQNVHDFAHVPNECATCKVGDQTVEGTVDFSVKIPQNQADIVFIIEQGNENEKVFRELVLPLVTELRTEFKQQGIPDVEVSMIGYGEQNKWPRYFTSGNKLNIESGDFSHVKFNPHDPIVTVEEARIANLEKKLTFFKQRLDVELGTYELTDAHLAAGKHNFRPGAAKAIVAVISDPCERSPFGLMSLQSQRLLWGYLYAREHGFTYYHVSPLSDLLVSGKPQKNVVGYDKHAVYTLNDVKDRPLKGDQEMRGNLALTGNDVCATFAEKTDGAAFSAKNFLDAKPPQRKQFITVAARKIADDLASKEIEANCSCDIVYGSTPWPSCDIASRSDKRHKPAKP